ncbi:MAG: hypothetical protein J4F41_09470 [Alphaproteobacteria bacterium]|nr:hypothetical protein [Alphaproteobacteria bacterium]
MTSYVPQAEANTWFQERDHADWAELPEKSRAAYLLKASEWIDRYFQFRGRKQDALQVRSWPRIDAYADDGTALTGIPPELREAVLVLAPVFAEGDEAAEAMLGLGRRIKQQKIGGVEVVFDAPSAGEVSRMSRLLQPLLVARHHHRIRRG